MDDEDIVEAIQWDDGQQQLKEVTHNITHNTFNATEMLTLFCLLVFRFFYRKVEHSQLQLSAVIA